MNNHFSVKTEKFAKWLKRVKIAMGRVGKESFEHDRAIRLVTSGDGISLDIFAMGVNMYRTSVNMYLNNYEGPVDITTDIAGLIDAVTAAKRQKDETFTIGTVPDGRVVYSSPYTGYGYLPTYEPHPYLSYSSAGTVEASAWLSAESAEVLIDKVAPCAEVSNSIYGRLKNVHIIPLSANDAQIVALDGYRLAYAPSVPVAFSPGTKPVKIVIPTDALGVFRRLLPKVLHHGLNIERADGKIRLSYSESDERITMICQPYEGNLPSWDIVLAESREHPGIVFRTYSPFATVIAAIAKAGAETVTINITLGDGLELRRVRFYAKAKGDREIEYAYFGSDVMSSIYHHGDANTEWEFCYMVEQLHHILQSSNDKSMAWRVPTGVNSQYQATLIRDGEVEFLTMPVSRS